MLFSSYTFIIIFLPVLIVTYYLIPNKCRNYLLLAASLFFYGWGGPKYLLVMLSSIFINYVAGLFVDRYRDVESKRKIATFAAVVGNLALLGYYKYTDFLIGTFNSLTGADVALQHIVLPIGISFYTFQGMSYVFDIGRGRGKVLKNPLKLALYISLFPQLIAGPIVRYETIEAQIDHRKIDTARMNAGIYRFMIGLAKKVLLANIIGEYVNIVFTMDIADLTATMAWTGTLAGILQIYYDFSGYSDMAIGLGAVFGFDFPENFKYPFVSASIGEFWHRWHVSLSTWFRDYVYIPLGGNRKGRIRQYINICVVWMLTGLWHGASWDFVLWGLYCALILMIERLLVKKPGEGFLRVFGHVYSILMLSMSFVLFEVPDPSDAVAFYKRMFDFSTGSGIATAQLLHVIREYGLIIAAGMVFTMPVYPALSAKFSAKFSERTVEITRSVIMVVLFFACFMRLVVSSYNPFIYFRF